MTEFKLTIKEEFRQVLEKLITITDETTFDVDDALKELAEIQNERWKDYDTKRIKTVIVKNKTKHTFNTVLVHDKEKDANTVKLYLYDFDADKYHKSFDFEKSAVSINGIDYDAKIDININTEFTIRENHISKTESVGLPTIEELEDEQI